MANINPHGIADTEAQRKKVFIGTSSHDNTWSVEEENDVGATKEDVKKRTESFFKKNQNNERKKSELHNI